VAGLRFTLDLYIDEDPAGTLVAGVKIPTALATKIPAIRQAVRDLKVYAKKVNAGKVNEELTVKASYHICYHNEAIVKPCAQEQDI
jgi:hypothetical protein